MGWLQRIHRQHIFFFIALAVLIPNFVPVPFPVPASNSTRSAFETIDSLKEGDTILLSFSFGPSSMAELQPQVESVVRHCFRKKLRVLMFSLWPDADPLSRKAVARVLTSDEFRDAGLREGTHFANFGYLQGGATVLLKMGQDLPQFVRKDARGELLQSLPVMQGIRNYNDIALVFDFAAGVSPDSWVVYGVERYGLKFAAGVAGVMASQMYPYLNAGQMKGLISGGVGAAEYETLMEYKADGTRRTNILSFVHVLVLLIIVVGNILYFSQRRNAPERQAT